MKQREKKMSCQKFKKTGGNPDNIHHFESII